MNNYPPGVTSRNINYPDAPENRVTVTIDTTVRPGEHGLSLCAIVALLDEAAARLERPSKPRVVPGIRTDGLHSFAEVVVVGEHEFPDDLQRELDKVSLRFWVSDDRCGFQVSKLRAKALRRAMF